MDWNVNKWETPVRKKEIFTPFGCKKKRIGVYSRKKQKAESMEKKKKKHIVLWIILGVLVIGLAVLGWFAYRVLAQPHSLFEDPVAKATAIPAATPLAPLFPVVTEEPVQEDNAPREQTAEAEPSAAPSDSSVDTIAPKGTLNIMLMGIDAYEDDTSTSGTMPHTDAMMVIAINFDENTVNLISLPRDTFTTAPGYRGYYKFNGVFNVGGGMDNPAGGFELVSRTAEQWLGGISIPYYYGLDFEAVKDIVDAIGGIDYDVDQSFWNMSRTKHYTKGIKHLDGDAVMGYIRIRKEADGKDSSRTARQRRMMVALFKKIKDEKLLSSIPALINAASSGIYTNTTLLQTTALANYAANLPSENIHTLAMSGTMRLAFEWSFCFVDQENRLEIIRDVFGIETDPIGTCTPRYERWLHNTGFTVLKSLRQCEKVFAEMSDQKSAGVVFSDEQIALYSDAYNAYVKLHGMFDDATEELGALYTGEEKTLTEYQEVEKAWAKLFNEQLDTVKKTTAQLANEIGYTGKLQWKLQYVEWYDDADINEVKVDFR